MQALDNFLNVSLLSIFLYWHMINHAINEDVYT